MHMPVLRSNALKKYFLSTNLLINSSTSLINASNSSRLFAKLSPLSVVFWSFDRVRSYAATARFYRGGCTRGCSSPWSVGLYLLPSFNLVALIQPCRICPWSPGWRSTISVSRSVTMPKTDGHFIHALLSSYWDRATHTSVRSYSQLSVYDPEIVARYNKTRIVAW